MMSHVDLEGALTRLYESENLTDELTDTAAKTLLEWGESQVKHLAETSPDADTFDERAKTLRRMLRGVNRVVGQRGTLAPEAQRESLQQIIIQAQSLDYQPSGHTPDALPTDDELQALRAVLNHIEGRGTDVTRAGGFQAKAAPVFRLRVRDRMRATSHLRNHHPSALTR